mmetsp:Transcript_60732/g.162556  ORF Transcript_60732/g.162556 Transcript_60732/m.162556 type:complete len:210 (-) Transcript_60732:972-1601(-)
MLERDPSPAPAGGTCTMAGWAMPERYSFARLKPSTSTARFCLRSSWWVMYQSHVGLMVLLVCSWLRRSFSFSPLSFSSSEISPPLTAMASFKFTIFSRRCLANASEAARLFSWSSWEVASVPWAREISASKSSMIMDRSETTPLDSPLRWPAPESAASGGRSEAFAEAAPSWSRAAPRSMEWLEKYCERAVRACLSSTMACSSSDLPWR